MLIFWSYSSNLRFTVTVQDFWSNFLVILHFSEIDLDFGRVYRSDSVIFFGQLNSPRFTPNFVISGNIQQLR